ncbi:DUF2651 family protein [Bacillus sp. Xin]|uniref:DUF2651 family protein n=2 Tax=unclassified Bacillus (in: firmicutes) TaxID=185979 RepID=UPI00157296BE|nr:DUF2651 family protein [Bacillus sp. Xin]NSW36453.1 DUF2651 family protein [Bacillus sp. Xin1]
MVGIFSNIMFLVLILFPVLTIILNAIVYWKFKKIFIMPIIIFIFSLLFMLIYANETLFPWVIIYTMLSLIVGLLIKFILSK